MKKMITHKDDLPDLASEILRAYPSERLFAFYGEMGAGKTTLIKEICRILGVTDQTSSPTFAIINEYYTTEDVPVYHFDFYRIDDIDELRQIGVEECR